MWIKICGTTSLRDAELAVEAGADALGFIFAPSPRQVTASAVRLITRRLPETIERYGIFVHPSFEQVVDTAEAAGLSGVQLHATEDRSLAGRLRGHFSAIEGRRRLGLLQVLHLPAAGLAAGPEQGVEAQMAALAADHAVDALLVDSRTPWAEGGTGLRFDWAAASGTFLRSAPHLRLIVAGGLAPENVAEAIATLRPWGVDVVSGVEAAPGRKDGGRMRAFVERARQASAALAAPASRQ